MGHVCVLLLSGSDIRFLGTTGPEPEPYKPRYTVDTGILCNTRTYFSSTEKNNLFESRQAMMSNIFLRPFSDASIPENISCVLADRTTGTVL